MAMPEEINRILTDRISDLLFCPTDTAINNLKKEGFDTFNCMVVKSGDVMQDAAIYYSKKERKPNINCPNNFILATIHRAENTDDPVRLQNIIEALNEIACETPVIIPLHPRTAKIILQRDAFGKNSKFSKGMPSAKIQNLTIIDPVGYLEMVYMLNRCQLVMTDSGGLQKEAFFFKKPCITLRDETEWIELVEHGFNTLVGANKKKILDAYHNLSFDLDFNIDLYGNGNASKNIISTLLSFQ